jgi:hypothetical protein
MADVASLAAAISGVASAGAELERRADEERAACEALAGAAEASTREQARIQNQLSRVEAELVDTECDASDLTHVLAFRKAQLAGTLAQVNHHKVCMWGGGVCVHLSVTASMGPCLIIGRWNQFPIVDPQRAPRLNPCR